MNGEGGTRHYLSTGKGNVNLSGELLCGGFYDNNLLATTYKYDFAPSAYIFVSIVPIYCSEREKEIEIPLNLPE